jgi:hypothetical protein
MEFYTASTWASHKKQNINNNITYIHKYKLKHNINNHNKCIQHNTKSIAYIQKNIKVSRPISEYRLQKFYQPYFYLLEIRRRQGHGIERAARTLISSLTHSTNFSTPSRYSNVSCVPYIRLREFICTS